MVVDQIVHMSVLQSTNSAWYNLSHFILDVSNIYNFGIYNI